MMIYNHKKYEQLKEKSKISGFSSIQYSEMYIKKRCLEKLRFWLLSD